MPQSLVTQIVEHLRESGGWVNGGEIERLALGTGYKASNASRRLRELHEDGLILREIRQAKGGRVRSVWYQLAEGKVVEI